MCKKTSILFLIALFLFCLLACHADVPQRQCSVVLSFSRGNNKSIQTSFSSALVFEYQIVLFGKQSQENGWTSFTSDSVQIEGIDEGVYNFYIRGRSGQDVYYSGLQKASIGADSQNNIVVRLDLCDDISGNGNVKLSGNFSLAGFDVNIKCDESVQTLHNVNYSFSYDKELACGWHVFEVSVSKNNIVLGGDSFSVYVPALGSVDVDLDFALKAVPTGTVVNIAKTHSLLLSKGDVVTFYVEGNNACTWTVGGKTIKTNDNTLEYHADSACKNLAITCQNGVTNNSCSVSVSAQKAINFFDLSYNHNDGYCCIGYENEDGNPVSFPYYATVYSEHPSSAELGLYPIEKAVSSLSSETKINYLELWLSDFTTTTYLMKTFKNADATPEYVVTHGHLKESFLAGMINLQCVYVKESTVIGLCQFLYDTNLTKVYIASTVNFINKYIFSGLTQNITIVLEHPVGTDITNWGEPAGSWKEKYEGTYNVVYLSQL